MAGTVLLVQPNIGARQKWDPLIQDSLVRATAALSRDAAARLHPDLIVWPEIALPVPLAYRPGWTTVLGRHAAESRAELLVGGIEIEDGHTFNAAFHFRPGAAPDRTYRKERLVPVFEWLNGVSRGGRDAPAATRLGRAGILICHEAAFEQLARDRRRDGAEFVVNLANDGWFLGTTAPVHHATHAVLRAIETRAAVVRVGNTGPSGVVDPLGRVGRWTSQELAVAVLDTVVTSPLRPPYARWGDWVGAASIVAMVGLVILAAARSGGASAGLSRVAVSP
jgi:apolipoprotein N-acyltransferase